MNSDNRPLKYGDNDRRTLMSDNDEVIMRGVSDASGNMIYLGRAKAGSIETDEKWQIRMLSYNSVDALTDQRWAENTSSNSSTDYVFVWDNAATTAITGISQANPGVVTMASNPFTDGDYVIIEGVVGMTEVNFTDSTATIYIVANGGATTFELTDINGTNVNTTGFTGWSSAGTVRAPNYLNYTFS